MNPEGFLSVTPMKVPQSMVWEMPPRRELVYNLPAGGRVRNWLPEVTALSPVSDVQMVLGVRTHRREGYSS